MLSESDTRAFLVINKHKLWSRVFTYIPTPTVDDGESIDENALRRVIDYQVEEGVDGICVLGSTGGNGSFADDEMKRITEVAARHAGGRIPVIAGTGARTTTACIRLSKHAQEVGCDGVMVLPVSYWPLTESEVYEHCERVAAAIQIPICVYNNPWTTGVDMKPEFLSRLTKVDNISCIKESTGDLTESPRYTSSPMTRSLSSPDGSRAASRHSWLVQPDGLLFALTFSHG